MAALTGLQIWQHMHVGQQREQTNWALTLRFTTLAIWFM